MRYFVFFCCCFALTFSSYASDEDLFDLSIEELMKVRISLATKTDETALTVPSTITIFEQKDIRALGVKNAFDIMNFVPGFQMTRGDWVGAVPKEHARGVYLDNGYILVMINGQRLNEVSFGKASLYTPHIPTEIIDRIEIIRGPGSALYGSNAFLGVLNIITDKSKNQLSVALGEHNTKLLSASWHKDLSKNINIYSNVSFEKADGETYTSELNREVKDPLKNKFAEVGLQYKNSELYLRYSESQLDEFLNIGGYSTDNTHRSETISSFIKTELIQSDNQQLSGKISYSHFEIKSAGMALPKESGIISEDFLVGPYWRTQSTDINLDHSWQINADLSINSGIEYRFTSQFQAGTATTHFDNQSQLIIPADSNYLDEVTSIENIPEYAALNHSHVMQGIYSQLKWRYSPKLHFFVGGRYDDVEDIESSFSPRGAIVWQANSNHSLKMQYGESFRTPVSNELYSNDSVTTGNENLKSEYVKTTEVVWIFQNTSFSSELVVFQNDLHDFINKVPFAGEATFTFDNTVNKRIRGLESSLRFNKDKNFQFSVNFTHLFNDPINSSFKNFASTNATYQMNKWRLNLNAIWRDEVTASLDDLTTFKQEQYTLVGGNINYKMAENHSISLVAENLLDKKYNVFDPRINNGAVPAKGRQTRLLYRYLF